MEELLDIEHFSFFIRFVLNCAKFNVVERREEVLNFLEGVLRVW
jgi:hypothetical protein